MGRAAAFPLAFMVFAIPLNVLDSLGFWLRLWVVEAGAAFARVVGIGVTQSGTLLASIDGRYQYDVAAACSGVRSLTALAALSLLAGYLTFRTWRRRGLALLVCLPLVYVGNVARIVAIIVAAALGGPAWGDRAHDVMGFGVFAIVLGGVLALLRWIERRWPEPEPTPAVPATDAVPAARTSSPRATLVVSVAVTVLSVAEIAWLHQWAQRPPNGGAGVALAADGVTPAELPAFISNEWAGRTVAVSAVEREILPADTGFAKRQYLPIGGAGPGVFLSVVLSGRDRTSIHRPELCLVGQGWTILGRREQPLRIGGETITVSVLSVRREAMTKRGRVVVPQVVVYWFAGGDATVASHWGRFGVDTWNRLAHGRVDRWAYILMQTDATDGEAAALARCESVLRGAAGVLRPVPSANGKKT
jgi:EpsI family protein